MAGQGDPGAMRLGASAVLTMASRVMFGSQSAAGSADGAGGADAAADVATAAAPEDMGF